MYKGVVRIGRINIFHLSKLWVAKFSIMCDVLFLGETAGGTWAWSLLGVKGLTARDSMVEVGNLNSAACSRMTEKAPPMNSNVHVINSSLRHSWKKCCSNLIRCTRDLEPRLMDWGTLTWRTNFRFLKRYLSIAVRMTSDPQDSANKPPESCTCTKLEMSLRGQVRGRDQVVDGETNLYIRFLHVCIRL